MNCNKTNVISSDAPTLPCEIIAHITAMCSHNTKIVLAHVCRSLKLEVDRYFPPRPGGARRYLWSHAEDLEERAWWTPQMMEWLCNLEHHPLNPSSARCGYDEEEEEEEDGDYSEEHPEEDLSLEMCEEGNLEGLKWLINHDGPKEMHKFMLTRDATSIHKAVFSGHLDVVSWLHDDLGMPLLDNLFELAAARGDLHMLQWLDERSACSWDVKRVILTATSYGRLEVAQWALGEWARGRDELYQWSRRCKKRKHPTQGLMLDLDTSDICDVVRGGHLECVRWLLAGDCQPYISTSIGRLNARTILRTAVILGDLDVCRFIKQSFQGHFTKGTSYSLRKVATRNGHPEIERWLQETVIA
ncbi:hypothetical protein QOT17_023788 [Balamuthia mandrillaris]